jgi:hypothetical protein
MHELHLKTGEAKPDSVASILHSLSPSEGYILWHVDQLLGNDGEIRNYTTAVVK